MSKDRTGSRGRLVALELVLLVGALSVLIWQPIGEVASLIVALVFALLFIGLFPVMLKGTRAAEAERETLQRRFQDQDDNRYR